MYLQPDVFVDAIILTLFNKNEDVVKLDTLLLEIYEKETANNNTITMDADFMDLYVFLLKDILQYNININDASTIQALLLKLKSHPIVIKDPDVYSKVKALFNTDTPMTQDKYKHLIARVSGDIVLYENIHAAKQIFGRLQSVGSSTSMEKRDIAIKDVTDICSHMVDINTTGILLKKEEDEHQARFADFSDRDTLVKALQVFKTVAVQNVFKSGWQALDKALGGGWCMGDSIVFNALSHMGKTMILLKMVRWQLMNPAPVGFPNPTVILYSLENETPQNLMILFREMYCNKYKTPPPNNLSDDYIVDFCIEESRANGWRLILDRRLGADFGYLDLVLNMEQYYRAGYTPLMVVIDYMNMMKKSNDGGENENFKHLQQLYTKVCNYMKSKNCTLITAHQLNRKAAEVASLKPLQAVKHFNISMLAEGMDPQREVDIVFYMHKEVDAAGRSFLTFKQGKNRNRQQVPDSAKYFAYMFDNEMGILDDASGTCTATTNILAVPFDEDKAQEEAQEKEHMQEAVLNLL